MSALLQVSADTYSFTATEVQAKQAELQTHHRVTRLVQVRRQEKQIAQLQRELYKENCQELAALEQAAAGQAWQQRSGQALLELQQQLVVSVARAGSGQKAAQAANQAAATRAAQRTAQRAAQLQLAKQRFSHALQLRHAEQTAAVSAVVTRLQRISDTKAAESARAHALAQQHRAVQAEEEANSASAANPAWNEAAMRNIDCRHTRLHELGSAMIVERNLDKGATGLNEAAETAARHQARQVHFCPTSLVCLHTVT